MRGRAARWIAACAFGLGLSGCALTPANDHYAFVDSGFDVPGDGDTVYFLLNGVAEHESGAYGLVLPDDWSTRPTVPDSSGVLRLAAPLALALVPGSELRPPIELERSEDWGHAPGASWMLRPQVSVAGLIPLRPLLQELSFDPAAARASASARLAVGASAYVLVRNTPEDGRTDLRLLGARPAEGRLDDLEWIELAWLQFEDDRGFGSKALARVGAVSEVTWNFVLPLAIATTIWIAVL